MVTLLVAMAVGVGPVVTNPVGGATAAGMGMGFWIIPAPLPVC